MDEDKSSFYVTLPSNGSKSYFPKNTGSNYKNKLATELILDGKWEVALSEIQYGRTWNALKKDSIFSLIIYRDDNSGKEKLIETTKADGSKESGFHFKLQYGVNFTPLIGIDTSTEGILSADVINVTFLKGNYPSPDFLARYAERAINREYVIQTAPFLDRRGNDVIQFAAVNYDEVSDRMMFRTICKDNALVIYSKDEIGPLFGFPKPKPGAHMKDYKFDRILKAPIAPTLYNFKALYVYSDIVEQERVGHDLVQLLRAVPIREYKEYTIFDKPYYKSITKSVISTIEMQVNDDTGALIDFSGGKVLCVLHFRRRL